jgi:hypothetical protein
VKGKYDCGDLGTEGLRMLGAVVVWKGSNVCGVVAVVQ